jgi:hypothetical protein
MAFVGFTNHGEDTIPGAAADFEVCLLFLSIVHIQIHTHLKWGGYG